MAVEWRQFFGQCWGVSRSAQFETLLTRSFLARFLHITARRAKESDTNFKEGGKQIGDMGPETDLLRSESFIVPSGGKHSGQNKRSRYHESHFEKRLKLKRNLKDVHHLLDGEVMFGVHPVLITLEQNRREFHRLFVKESLPVDEGLLRKIAELAEIRGIEVVPLPLQVLDSLSKGGPHQGVCLDTSPRRYATVTDGLLDEEVSDKQVQRLWLYLDQIQDPRNMGAVIRSSYFFAVEKIFVPKENSCRLSSVVHKASSGAMELMDLYALKDVERFLQHVRKKSWNIIGSAGTNDQSDALPPKLDIDEYRYNSEKNTVLILGNEGKGLSPYLLPFCDCLVTVRPQRSLNPAVDSLNVSVATGILLHTLTRNMRSR